MKPKLLLIIPVLFTLSFVTGCTVPAYFRPAVALPITEVDYQSGEVAIAVAPSGIKHIARTECPLTGSDPCKLIYTLVNVGLPGFSTTAENYLPAAGEQVANPDIVVTQSGIAFIVYRLNGRSGATVASELWARRSDTWDTPILVEGGSEVIGNPIATALGEMVHVTYTYLNGAHHAIKYARLNDLAQAGIIESAADADFDLVDAVTGSGGSLFVIYKSGVDLRYADNVGLVGLPTDMTKHLTVDSTVNDKPDISVGGEPETVYIIYSKAHPGTSDELLIGSCPASTCPAVTSVAMPLDPTLHWSIQVDSQIVANSSTDTYYVFGATNDDNSNVNGFVGDYVVGEVSIDIPYRGTDTPENESSPRMCLFLDMFPAGTWRIDLGTGYYGNLYEFDFLNGFRQLRQTSTSVGEYDTACEAEWFGTIWNEENAGIRQAWVDFNAYATYMPMTIK